MRRYHGGLADSARWDGFEFRPDDVVISTPSKCGTTWLQMICALLILQRTELPAPLTELSPWLDMRLRPIEEVRRRLDAQRHRRFIKTHTPLDGLPSVPGVTFLVCGRDPRDVAISMDHHRENLDRQTINRLLQAKARAAASQLDHRGRVMQTINHLLQAKARAAASQLDHRGRVMQTINQLFQAKAQAAASQLDHRGRVMQTINHLLQAKARAAASQLDHRGRVMRWIEADDPPETSLSSLRGTTWHLAGAWARRHDPDVILTHYADLSADLETQMRMIADRLGITVPADRWPALAEAATLPRMRANADATAPDERIGLLTDRGKFFHAGTSGQWRTVLTPDDLRSYHARLSELAPADLIGWMHDR